MNTEILQTASLYVLVYPSQGLMKIGKANNVHVRCKVLKATWGAADYANSYELVTTQEIAFKLETSLHFMLTAHKAEVDEADGHTEMFSLEALDIAVMHIDLFVASSRVPMQLKKGILPPHVALKERKAVACEKGLDITGVGAIGHIGVMAWAVYCIIRAQAVDDRKSAKITCQKIADLIGVSVCTVYRAVTVLGASGLLEIDKSHGTKNHYVWA